MGEYTRRDKGAAHLDKIPTRIQELSHSFHWHLAADLAEFPGQKLDCVLLQEVDDLLLASTMKAQCLEGIKALLSLLMEAGYQVPKKKAQICKKQVKYLGFSIMQG